MVPLVRPTKPPTTLFGPVPVGDAGTRFSLGLALVSIVVPFLAFLPDLPSPAPATTQPAR